jgi:predicted transglutaminase-like cysteine proteinase
VVSAGTTYAALDRRPELIAMMVAQYGEAAGERTRAWYLLMDQSPDRSDEEKLEQVNDFFNRIPYAEDLAHWGSADYWATPAELLATNGGDCEDYATAKYFTLIELGIDEDRLRLTYVKATGHDQTHMVLTYFETPHAVPLVLDNLEPRIRSADERDDLVPVYSFNGSGLWLAKSRGLGRQVGSAERLDPWRELRERMP